MAAIEIKNLTKSFGPNRVLDGLDLTIAAGEFVGLMGPNGAGKSTLIKILGGIYAPSSGEILYGGRPVRSLAEQPEVGFIHQDLGLVDSLSVVDNLRLGEPPMRLFGPILDGRRERESAREALARVELDCPVDTPVGALAPGERALVAVARLLQRGAEVLFIDEATSTLPPGDARRLIGSLANTAGRGATIIMVSHKLSEILDATERVVVLLDGRIAADERSAELDREGLTKLVVSGESRVARAVEERTELGPELLSIESAWGGRAGPVDLVVRSGEAVGLTGLSGSGLHDIAYLAHGSLPCRRGRVRYQTGARSALVPPHRETQGGFPELSVTANLTVSSLRRWRSVLRTVRAGAERRDAEEMVGRLNVQPADPDARFGALSGGNKQKVVFGRVLFSRPSVYILCEPTRGVDIGTRMEIYRLIRELRDGGAGILVVTSDFEDLFALCDRISIIESGRPSDFLAVDETSAQELEAFV